MKQNKMWLILLLFIISIITINYATAAVTNCVAANLTAVADNTGAWPKFNDTGTIKNVSEGKVCYNTTYYNGTAFLGAYCELYRDCVANQCWIESLFAGFAGNGTTSCSTNTSLLSTPVGINGPTIGVDYQYRVNTTSKSIAVLATGSGCTVETAAANVLNYCGVLPYIIYGNSSFCDGFKGNLTDTNVAAGKVCNNGTSVAPNSSTSCGTWNQCVSGATSYATYYTGYTGDGTATCTATDWVATGSSVTISSGQVLTTENTASTCSIAASDVATVSGITKTKQLAYAGFALLAVMIIATIAWGIIQIFKGGSVDFMTIAIAAVAGGVIILLAYMIIYYVALGLGA